jgi:two-component system sensor histidine kinase PhoQ
VTNSLHVRLSLTALLVLAIFLISTGAVLDNAFLGGARLGLRERMLGQLYLLLAAVEVDGQGRLVMPLPTALPEPQMALRDSGVYAFIGKNGRKAPLWLSPSLLNKRPPPPFDLAVGEKRWLDVRMEDGRDYSMLGFGFQQTTKTGVHPFNVYILSELAPLHEQVRLYRRRLWGGLAGAAFLLLTVQALVLRWGLRPLRVVARELGAIEAGAKNRLDGQYPREVKQLTDNINTLLTQERARQTRYRNALADLAHSLKTPLAVLRGAIDRPDALAAAVDEQTVRMCRIVERQLQRAATAGGDATGPAIPVRPVVERLAVSLRKVYRDKNVKVSNQVDPELRFRGDEADLMEILGNLIDNGFKWCRGRVRIQGQRENQDLILGVHDDGPGIDARHAERILERGVRADESAPGHGIGLAVTADIVEAYQGRIRIGSSALGGAAVTVEFPG